MLSDIAALVSPAEVREPISTEGQASMKLAPLLSMLPGSHAAPQVSQQAGDCRWH